MESHEAEASRKMCVCIPRRVHRGVCGQGRGQAGIVFCQRDKELPRVCDRIQGRGNRPLSGSGRRCRCGVREIISAGSCGALEQLDESVFLVPRKALRDEGTSYHYAPPSRFIEIDERARKAIEKTILEHNLNYREVVTWSTDGFFRETREKVEYRKSEGCSVVEMECSALAACASFRKATWGMILYTADCLANVDQYDERNWGGNAYEYALALCLDAVLAI